MTSKWTERPLDMLESKGHEAKKGGGAGKGRRVRKRQREVNLEGDMTTLVTMSETTFCIFIACSCSVLPHS